MKRSLQFKVVLLVAVSLVGAFFWKYMTRETLAARSKYEEGEQRTVAGLVGSFGQRLQRVSLLAPSETVEKAMCEQYGGLVAPGLIATWSKDPQKAPGRRVSSPWPDRIEISSIAKVSEQVYKVDGQIIEVTSVEKVNGGAAARRDVSILVEKVSKQWLITSVEMGGYDGALGDPQKIAYDNTDCGFKFALPESWQGYSVLVAKWEGTAVDGPLAGKVVESGPLLQIRHPGWTTESPRQDIPIMVFTLSQWNRLQAMEFSVGAATIGPSELGRNSQYVSACPARYNYAFLPGFEEVQAIFESRTLKPYDVQK